MSKRKRKPPRRKAKALQWTLFCRACGEAFLKRPGRTQRHAIELQGKCLACGSSRLVACQPGTSEAREAAIDARTRRHARRRRHARSLVTAYLRANDLPLPQDARLDVASSDEVREWLDAYVMRVAPTRLSALLKFQLKPDATGLSIEDRRSGFALFWDQQEVGWVAATSATAFGKARHGNYLQIGPHWTTLSEELATGLRRNQELHAQFVGLATKFFRDADIDFVSTAEAIPTKESTFRRWLNRRAMLKAGDVLAEYLKTRLESFGVPLSVSRKRGRFDVKLKGGELVGRVSPAGALIESRHLRGNFLITGAHWDELIESLGQRAQEIEQKNSAHSETGAGRAERVRSQSAHQTSFKEFPPSVPDDLRTRALEASGKIRAKRSLAFDTEVEITLSDGRVIRFWPIRRRRGALEAPFRMTYESRLTDGALDLERSVDPLPLVLYGEPDVECPGREWALALVAFAELTVVPVKEISVTTRTQRSRSSALAQKSRRTRALPASNRIQYLNRLRATGNSLGALSSIVAGHRRRLRPGHHASAEAVRAAASVGIQLGADETWVRAFTRGQERADLLTFDLNLGDFGIS